MDRATVLLSVGRITVFLVAVFMVLTLIFLAFFVVSDEARMLPRGPSTSSIFTDAIIDDLKLNRPTGEQYVNFMIKMLSGEFFLSIVSYPLERTSDFIYVDVLTTAFRIAVITGFAIVGGFGYAVLANMRQERVYGGIFRLLALCAAALPGIVYYLIFRTIVGRADFFLTSYESFSTQLIVFCTISLGATSALVFERVVRHMPFDRSINLVTRILRAMSTSRVSAVLPLYLAFMMTTVVAAESFHTDGVGALLCSSLDMYDMPVFMACVFIISSILLIMFLAVDLTIIYVSGPHTVQHWSENSRVEKFRTRVGACFNRRVLARLWTAYRKSRTGTAALVAFAILIAVALLAPLLATVDDPFRYDPSPDSRLLEPSLSESPITGYIHPLGTDVMGRDVYSMLLYDSLESVTMVVSLAVVSLLIGVSSALAGNYIRRLDSVISRSIAWAGWVIADVFIALTLFLSIAVMAPIGRPTTVFALMLIAWTSAPFVKIEVTRTIIPGCSRGDHERAYETALHASIARSLHISKFVVLFGFLSIVSAVILLPRFEPIELGWANMIESAFSYGPSIYRIWWLVFPPAILIGVLATLSYVILDVLEKAFERWPEFGESESSPDVVEAPAVDCL